MRAVVFLLLGTIVDLGAASAMPSDLFFFHIPKTGGRTISNSAKRSGVLWSEWADYGNASAKGAWCSPWHMPMYHSSVAPIYKNKTVFCVVRNPFHRLVSDFMWWRLGCSKKDLNMFVRRVVASVAFGSHTGDCHFTPQSHLIWHPQTRERWCNEVLRFESLPSCFESLMERHGLNISVGRTHVGKGRCRNLSIANLTRESIHAIRLAYADDFRLLHYKPRISSPE